jgi:hypothetical protein
MNDREEPSRIDEQRVETTHRASRMAWDRAMLVVVIRARLNHDKSGQLKMNESRR